MVRLDEVRVLNERSDNPISILLIDIDHFKNSNDVKGHLAIMFDRSCAEYKEITTQSYRWLYAVTFKDRGGVRMGVVKSFFKKTVEIKDINKVLDVGVGRGDFLNVLFDCFHENTHFTGVDIVQDHLEIASGLYKYKNVEFLKMSAENLEFGDDQFDVVCISNTLHHLKDACKVIEEMKRVVKPSGYIVIHEMVNDNQTEKQNIHVWLHHINADIDSETGIYHGHTYSRNEIEEIMNGLNLVVLNHMSYLIQDEKSLGDEKAILDNTFAELNRRINEIDEDEIKEKFRNDLNQNAERIYKTGFALATEYMAITRFKD